jgi:outer membrane protein insertion porin family
LTNTIGVDTRDSFLTPTKGYNLSLATTYSGFGSKVEYLRNVLSGAYHMPLAEDWVLSLGGRAGYLYDINDETPLYENFQSGGNNLRGFARSGIGPRDSTTGDALGGDLMLGTNVELRFPFPGLKDTGVSGLFFMDGGIVSKFDDQPQNVVANDEVYRISIGTGIFWRSPLGPLRIDFGIPIVKADNDETEVFSFSLGTRF